MAQEIVQTAGRKRSGAVLVGAGILLSRISGLIREIAFAHFFGNSDAADVFKAALRIPNFLQNLFGEGALSASFIPVYAGLRARGETEEACKLAGGVAVLLGLAVSVLVLVGVLSAPLLVDIITPGFEGAKRLAVIDLVRILFPGAGLLVFSAWCLGVLNSHRRFFMSYAAPVIWNASLIAALLIYGGRCREYDLALILAWSSVLGSLLQLLVQLPTTIKLVEKLVLKVDRCLQSLRLVVRNFFPVVIGRGVVQISAYVDSIIASLLPSGALASLMYAQTIYLLPVGLFGIAVSAAELPELSSAAVLGEGAKDMMRKNLAAGLRKISFFILPAIVVFIGLGQQIIGAVYQSGRFSAQDTLYVWAALAGLAPGLYAATLGRLYASGFFALHNTKIPVRCAVLR
ncbi:MAG TPA: murein biosynthesis integral membrane protein MurJ, partial [Oligoflexia bacterium]|nr:murein biosynthesis integral membrane protein MurJ [Oligoflexia bacterium]